MPPGVPRVPAPFEWIKTKRCRNCGQTKPWALFTVVARWPDGTARYVHAQCRECVNARRRELGTKERWRLSNLDRVRARQARWASQRRARLRAERAPRSGPLVDVAPFRGWVQRRAREYGGMDVLCRALPVNERAVRRVMSESETVTLSFVDSCLTALGEHVSSLYADETIRPPEAPRLTVPSTYQQRLAAQLRGETYQQRLARQLRGDADRTAE